MTDYEIYSLVICLVVFVLLTVLSAICITAITKMSKRLIRCGEEDEKLITEYKKTEDKNCRAGNVIATIFNVLICVIFVAALIFSLYINSQDASVSDTIPTYRVVKSDSMSEKYSVNTYLYDNDLNDQFDTFDILLTYKMPDESELKLYDIVVYEFRGELIIHRIVAIEEPNETHPESRLFTLQGDANQYSDTLQVEYSQMKGIYYGERVRFAGSFILFLQSPAGWLCVLLILAAVIIAPMTENYIGKSKYRRLVEIGVIQDDGLLSEIQAENRAREANKTAVVAAAENKAAAAHTADVFGDMPSGFYDKVRIPAKTAGTGGSGGNGGKGGNGFYDLVELYPDGNYRTVQTEDEQRSKKNENFC